MEPKERSYSESRPGRARKSRLAGKEDLWGYLFILPWLVGFLSLTAFPLFSSAYISLCNWNILGTPQYTGIKNYLDLLGDERAKLALYNTIYMAAFNIPLGTLAALGLAVLVNQKLRFIRLFRLIFYLPSVVSGISLIMVWNWILNSSDKGLLNILLKSLGLNPVGWLTTQEWSKPSIVMMQLFLVGGGMMIFLAGLQNVPEHLYESAEIDGASRWKKFLHITLPMISPTLFFQTTMGIIGYFQNFSQAYLMTGGGPADSSLVLGLYIWRKAFEWYQMGAAVTLAWVLFAIIMVFTAIQFFGGKYWVYYEAGDERH